MEMFISLFLLPVRLSLTAIDIISFFVIIRMLRHKLDYAWIRAFDQAGGSLVDLYISLLEKLISRVSNRRFLAQGMLNIAIILLAAVKILIAIFLIRPALMLLI
jgi:hypothetical protein